MDPRPARTVLVLGANGRFGAAAVQAFADAGWQVLAQARRTPSSLPAGATHVAIRLEDGETLAAAALGATVVVHAVNPVYTQWARDAMPLLRNGLDVAQRLGALFMLPGNVYNYGERMPSLLGADTPMQPTTRKGRIRCAMEDEMRARAASGLRSVVIRAGDFYGGGTGSWLDQLIVRGLARGKLAYPGPRDVPHAWAYLPDLARCFVAAAQAPALPQFAQLEFAGDTLTGDALLAAIRRAAKDLGIDVPSDAAVGGIPWPLLRAGGLLVPIWRELAEMSYLWRVPHAIDGARTRALLGQLPRTGLDAAMRATLLALGFGNGAVAARAGGPASAAGVATR